MIFIFSYYFLILFLEMKLINTFIYTILKFSPKRIVKIFSKRYVAGFSFKETLDICKNLNNEGFALTLDMLGEHTKTKQESDFITNQYKKLLITINEERINANISIKPSHIGHDLSLDFFEKNLLILIKKAQEFSNFIRIDMESSQLTDDTIYIYKKLSKEYPNFGIVLQSYLFRTYDDIKSLDKSNLNFRLCKGIYRESADIAYQNKQKINESYLAILDYAISNQIYVGIATHDEALLKESYKIIKKHSADRKNFEFQGLYGVPLQKWYKKHFENDYKVRIYVPFGINWYEYSLRRIKENPSIAKYVIKNLFKR